MTPTTPPARRTFGPHRSYLTVPIAAWLLCISIGVARAETPMADQHDHSHHSMAMPQGGGGYQRSEVSYAVPDLTFRDRHGQTVHIGDLLERDRPVMLNFIFTSCTAICPVMTATFAQVQAGLGEERHRLRMVSVSIDPEHDTPDRLARYADTFKAEDNWRFLTGTTQDSIALQRAFNVYRGDKMNHSPVAFIRVSPQAPWVRIDGFTTARDLIKEYRRLQAHVSAK